MKPYIELNTHLRIDSKNTFEQEYYKLLNNSVHGKWMEEVTEYVLFELFTSNNSSNYKRYYEEKLYMIKRKMVHTRCPTPEADPNSEACAAKE